MYVTGEDSTPFQKFLSERTRNKNHKQKDILNTKII